MNMDMLTYVRDKRKLTEKEARPLFQQICAIVADFHSKGIVLRDVKLRKFVFKDPERTQLTLGSWDEAIVLANPRNDLIDDKNACPLYASPEILHKSTTHYSGRRVDCWCLGVILYTMLTGHYPFHDPDINILFAKIRKGQLEVPDSLSPTAEFLIRGLLNRQPKERLTARAAMQDRWFTEKDVYLEPSNLLPESQLLETYSYSSHSPSRSHNAYKPSSHRTAVNSSAQTLRSHHPYSLQQRYLPSNRVNTRQAHRTSISNDQIVPEINTFQHRSNEIFHWTLTSGLLS
ncbi:tribbles homolog 2 [Tetranychus urticae]|uniref:Protein kinase domain-containing protein n=1 Tax=Tetranychus urticae TaxID=32264 RepID=T1KGG3_TETUR|nr:tribbles homolog 2 [Tetranychus urticae]